MLPTLELQVFPYYRDLEMGFPLALTLFTLPYAAQLANLRHTTPWSRQGGRIPQKQTKLEQKKAQKKGCNTCRSRAHYTIFGNGMVHIKKQQEQNRKKHRTKVRGEGVRKAQYAFLATMHHRVQ
jgi:hypothetical protein